MEESTHKILLTARKMFMKYGIKSVSMDDIARDLRISKKTLYKSFDSKRQLVREIILHHHEEEQATLADIVSRSVDAVQEMVLLTQNVKEMLRQFKPTMMYDLQKYHKSSWEQLESLHNKWVFEAIKNNLKKGVVEGLYRAEINVEIVSKFYTALTLVMVRDPKFISDDASVERIYSHFIDYHLHAIMTQKGKNSLAINMNNE